MPVGCCVDYGVTVAGRILRLTSAATIALDGSGWAILVPSR